MTARIKQDIKNRLQGFTDFSQSKNSKAILADAVMVTSAGEAILENPDMDLEKAVNHTHDAIADVSIDKFGCRQRACVQSRCTQIEIGVVAGHITDVRTWRDWVGRRDRGMHLHCLTVSPEYRHCSWQNSRGGPSSCSEVLQEHSQKY